MSATEQEFLKVLNRIANSLQKISESLDGISKNGKKETEQYVKESNLKIRKDRILLSESVKKLSNPEKDVEKILRS